MAAIFRFRHILSPAGLQEQREIHVGDDGRIEAVVPWDGKDAADGWLALPGMPNGHSHVFQRALAGYGEARSGQDTFWGWREAMYRLANGVSAEDLLVIARAGYTAMLAAGFTSVAEFHYLHRLAATGPAATGDIIAQAAEDAGIRLRILPVYYESGNFGEPARPDQGRFLHAGIDDFLQTLQALDRHAPGLAIHSLRAVRRDSLGPLVSEAMALLGEAAPIHVHAAEQTAEVAACRERYGCGPISLLGQSVELGPRWNVVHATHADAAERRAMIEAGSTVVLCPLTEAYLGDGIFPAREFAAAGGLLAVGSDSNVRLDAVEELRLLEYGQRLSEQARARLASEDGLGAALWGRMGEGGRAPLGMDVGRLAPGSLADFVTVDPDHPDLLGADGPGAVLDALVTAADRSAIEGVFVGGRRVVTRLAPDLARQFRARVRALMGGMA